MKHGARVYPPNAGWVRIRQTVQRAEGGRHVDDEQRERNVTLDGDAALAEATRDALKGVSKRGSWVRVRWWAHRRATGEGVMSKYDPLYTHLTNLTADSVGMTFAEIDAVLGFDLPQSARQHRAWWANEAPETTRHRHSRAWTLAGRTATPNMKTETVLFKKRSS
jgi:hypothetical protein